VRFCQAFHLTKKRSPMGGISATGTLILAGIVLLYSTLSPASSYNSYNTIYIRLLLQGPQSIGANATLPVSVESSRRGFQ